MGKFKYEERAEDTYKQRTFVKDSSKESFYKPGYKFYQAKDGNNKIRILPPTWDNPEHYGLDIYMHYKIGGSNSSYLCLQKMKNKPCPICEALARPDVKADKEFSDAIGIKKKVLVWTIDRTDEATGPKLWPMPTSLDRQFVIQSADEDTGEILRIDHHEHGYDVSFDKSGKDIKTKYEGEKISRHESPLHQDKKVMDEWLSFIMDNPIPDVLQYHDYDHVKAVFSGSVAPDEDDAFKKAVNEAVKSPAPATENERDALMELALEAGVSFKDLKGMTTEEIRKVLETPDEEKDEDAFQQEQLRNKVKAKYGNK